MHPSARLYAAPRRRHPLDRSRTRSRSKGAAPIVHKEWDSTTHDLSVFRPSAKELLTRSLQAISPNNPLAAQELRKRLGDQASRLFVEETQDGRLAVVAASEDMEQHASPSVISTPAAASVPAAAGLLSPFLASGLRVADLSASLESVAAVAAAAGGGSAVKATSPYYSAGRKRKAARSHGDEGQQSSAMPPSLHPSQRAATDSSFISEATSAVASVATARAQPLIPPSLRQQQSRSVALRLALSAANATASATNIYSGLFKNAAGSLAAEGELEGETTVVPETALEDAALAIETAITGIPPRPRVSTSILSTGSSRRINISSASTVTHADADALASTPIRGEKDEGEQDEDDEGDEDNINGTSSFYSSPTATHLNLFQLRKKNLRHRSRLAQEARAAAKRLAEMVVPPAGTGAEAQGGGDSFMAAVEAAAAAADSSSSSSSSSASFDVNETAISSGVASVSARTNEASTSTMPLLLFGRTRRRILEAEDEGRERETATAAMTPPSKMPRLGGTPTPSSGAAQDNAVRSVMAAIQQRQEQRQRKLQQAAQQDNPSSNSLAPGPAAGSKRSRVEMKGGQEAIVNNSNNDVSVASAASSSSSVVAFVPQRLAAALLKQQQQAANNSAAAILDASVISTSTAATAVSHSNASTSTKPQQQQQQQHPRVAFGRTLPAAFPPVPQASSSSSPLSKTSAAAELAASAPSAPEAAASGHSEPPSSSVAPVAASSSLPITAAVAEIVKGVFPAAKNALGAAATAIRTDDGRANSHDNDDDVDEDEDDGLPPLHELPDEDDDDDGSSSVEDGGERKDHAMNASASLSSATNNTSASSTASTHLAAIMARYEQRVKELLAEAAEDEKELQGLASFLVPVVAAAADAKKDREEKELAERREAERAFLEEARKKAEAAASEVEARIKAVVATTTTTTTPSTDKKSQQHEKVLSFGPSPSAAMAERATQAVDLAKDKDADEPNWSAAEEDAVVAAVDSSLGENVDEAIAIGRVVAGAAAVPEPSLPAVSSTTGANGSFNSQRVAREQRTADLLGLPLLPHQHLLAAQLTSSFSSASSPAKAVATVSVVPEPSLASTAVSIPLQQPVPLPSFAAPSSPLHLFKSAAKMPLAEALRSAKAGDGLLSSSLPVETAAPMTTPQKQVQQSLLKTPPRVDSLGRRLPTPSAVAAVAVSAASSSSSSGSSGLRWMARPPAYVATSSSALSSSSSSLAGAAAPLGAHADALFAAARATMAEAAPAVARNLSSAWGEDDEVEPTPIPLPRPSSSLSTSGPSASTAASARQKILATANTSRWLTPDVVAAAVAPSAVVAMVEAAAPPSPPLAAASRIPRLQLPVNAGKVVVAAAAPSL